MPLPGINECSNANSWLINVSKKRKRNVNFQFLEHVRAVLLMQAGNPNDEVSGFKWRPGSERHTTGIWIWSKLFTTMIQSGEKIDVLLMDTQGTFDTNTDMMQNIKIFALSTLLSSIQIYNIGDNINENDLQNLELFTQYGKLAIDENNREKPFQQLLFLIRDWRFSYQFPYGIEGGRDFLDSVLNQTKNQHKDISTVRHSLKSSFEELSCYLMPYPGQKAAETKEFDGKLKDLDNDFIKHLEILIPSLISPNVLLRKPTHSRNILFKDFELAVQNYFELFQSENLPNTKTILNATIEFNYLRASFASIDMYNMTMEAVSAVNLGVMETEEILQAHINVSTEICDLFTKKKFTTNIIEHEQYLLKLEIQIQRQFLKHIARNDLKKTQDATETMKNLNNKIKILEKKYADRQFIINELKENLLDVERTNEEEKGHLLKKLNDGRTKQKFSEINSSCNIQ